MDNLYAILELEFKSTDKQIRKAYLKLAKIWHPDKNPGIDVTEKMQNIIYAYEILSDSRKKVKYDIEYLRYFKFTNSKTQKTNSKTKSATQPKSKFNDIKSDYKINDETLEKWMKEAKYNALKNYKIFTDELRNSFSIGFSNFFKGVLGILVYVFIISIIAKILYLIFG